MHNHSRKPEVPPAADDARFRARPLTLWIDRFMTAFIKVGGIGVIVAVLGILVFVFLQIVPLFQGATVSETQAVRLAVPPEPSSVLALDEWTELPILARPDGTLELIALEPGQTPLTQVNTRRLDFGPGAQVTALRYNQRAQALVYGFADGSVRVVKIDYRPEFDDRQQRRITAGLSVGEALPVGRGRVVAVDYIDAGTLMAVAAIVERDGQRQVAVCTLKQRMVLGSAVGSPQLAERLELHATPARQPQDLRLNDSGDAVVASTADGELLHWHRNGETYDFRGALRPFADTPHQAVTQMDWIFGGTSLSVGNRDGANAICSIILPKGEGQLALRRTQTLAPLGTGVQVYARSLRNKAFFVGGGRRGSLRYATTGSIRWEHDLPAELAAAALSAKYDSLLLLDRQGSLHFFRVADPHPEAGIRAFFGRLWYEGTSGPAYEWQSTGAGDEYEAKLSMIPLLAGTLKGTFYAMLFATPIALLAALYCSQFQHPRFRMIVKPTMEAMASLPSVVLGFLAALWLAPLIEHRIPAVLAFLALAPLAAMLFGLVWSMLPQRHRIRIKPGYEFLAYFPIVVACFFLAVALGPVCERWWFLATDPATGQQVADFRLWWPQATGASFQQRNALVVGFIMGFAVIPIVFTIAEDSLSSVPQSLVSASLALGASRWQTALRVVLPTAAAGVFSALMIGLGRAVGETMIVLMATGNTPVMNWNLFDGMRTLSANIAVELPEAPQGGTLYRSLFLGAFLLFAMTFVLNTAAELLRHHLRQKYKTV